MANAHHHEQRTLELQEAAATFVGTVSNRASLITITRSVLTPNEDRVTFYVSVFPVEAEGPAVGFLMRKRAECKEYLKKTLQNGKIPHVEFVLDEGEKKRQRVDELLNG
jgi:ribosome-binding factor A